MKNITIYPILILLFSVLSWAQVINVKPGWQLLGATEDSASMCGFNSKCVKSVWTYDNGRWSSYEPALSSNTLSSIKKGVGFWVNMETCTDTNLSTNVTCQDVNVSSAEIINMIYSLQKSRYSVYESNQNLSKKLVSDVDKMKTRVETMASRVTYTIEKSYELIKLLSKSVEINSLYKNIFSTTTSYDTNTPYFIMSQLSNKNFLLVSSSTPIFSQYKTIKTSFSTPASLLVAWQRSIANYTKGNLYFNIYEILEDGITNRVSNTMFIPAKKMLTI